MNEWIANEQAICSVCHTDVNSQDPPVKVFPAKFIEKFDMTFNHAKHERITGCSDCHQRSGKGKTIPVGFQAHADCYGCHTAETKLGQCSYCHKLAPHYNRTVQSEYSFGTVKFTHGGRHSDISCTECHRVVPGAENSRQVKNIAILEHRTTPGDNCLKCHNGSRAFNGNNQNDRCERCHNGPKIVYLPSGSYSGAAEEAPAEN